MDLILESGSRWIFCENLFSQILVEFPNLNFLWQAFFSNTSKWLHSLFNHWCLFFRKRFYTVKYSQVQNREGRGEGWVLGVKKNWKLISRWVAINRWRGTHHILPTKECIFAINFFFIWSTARQLKKETNYWTDALFW